MTMPVPPADREAFYRFMDSVFDKFDGLPGRYDIADAILSHRRLMPVEQKAYPPHEIDVERFPGCTVCGRDVQWDDDAQEWKHLQ